MKRLVLVSILTVAMAFSFTAAYAEADIGFKGTGVRGGIVSPDNLDTAFFIGLMSHLGYITPDVALRLTADWWQSSYEFSGFGASSTVDFRDIAIAVQALYMFPTEGSLNIFAGGGLGLHFLNADVPEQTTTIGGQTFSSGGGSASDTEFGIDLGGGLGFEANEKSDVTAELWYRIVSDADQFMVAVSWLYWYGR